MADISIDHESGDISDYYDGFSTLNGTVSVTEAAAMNGTVFGLESTAAGANGRAWGYRDTPTPQGTVYTVDFYLDLNSITMGNNTDLEVFVIREAAGTVIIFIEIKYSGGYTARLSVYDDNSAQFFSGFFSISDSAVFVEIVVNKASSDVAADGSVLLKVDSVTEASITNLDFYDMYPLMRRLSAGLSGLDAGNTGTIYIDEITATSSPVSAYSGTYKTPQAFIEDEGAGADGGAGGGAGGNDIDISADGLSLYIATFNVFGVPVLIKISTFLSADGSIVFNEADGGRIGVQCGELNEDVVWVAGNFGGVKMIEKSEDAGASWTVKNESSLGTVRTFQVGPGNDERVLVFDGDNGDILETVDDGETWTTINAAVTPLINSIGRLSVDLQEIMAGNQGDVTDSVNYSPNSGVNLEDYQTGPYPATDATKIQVT